MTIIKLGLLGFFLTASNVWACRPNFKGVQHRLSIAAIEAVHSKTGLAVMDLKETELLDLDMKWIERDAGLHCPDYYKALLKLTYDLKVFEIEVVSAPGKPVSTTIKE